MQVKKISIKKRICFLIYLMLFCFGALFLRLGYVKIIKANSYYELALDLWTRSAPIIGQRGNIYDRNGNLLVGSILTPTIVAMPSQITDELAAEKIAKVLNVSEAIVKKHLKKKVSVEILKPFGQKISIEKAYEIAKLKIKGIYIVGDTSRYYPYGNILAHTLGIVGIDNQGISGLEYIYDSYLKGEKSLIQVFTDAHGNLMDDFSSYYKKSKASNDLYLTLDLKVQLALDRVLNNAYNAYQTDESFGLVMNPQDSSVLAIASYPTFDLINYQDYDQAVYNRNLPLWKSFEPGSTFKILTYAAGIEEQVFKPNDLFFCSGYRIVEGVRIKDWKAGGHGKETFEEVLQNSCNPGFMEIGLRLGKKSLFEYIRKAGYGKKTGIDLLGESSGIVFRDENIGPVELATSSFGQGNSCTSIQLVNATSALVNGGMLNKPYIVKDIKNQGKTIKTFSKEEIRRVISEETSKTVRTAVEKVVALGTGRGGFIPGFRVGGKTGTAQIALDGKYVPGKYILSFIGIAPMDDPQVVCYIGLTGCKGVVQYGGVVVAPLVKEVLTESFVSLDIEKRKNEIPFNPRLYVDLRLYDVPNFMGMKVSDARRENRFNFLVYGNGSRVIDQIPEEGMQLVEGGYVILYT